MSLNICQKLGVLLLNNNLWDIFYTPTTFLILQITSSATLKSFKWFDRFCQIFKTFRIVQKGHQHFCSHILFLGALNIIKSANKISLIK